MGRVLPLFVAFLVASALMPSASAALPLESHACQDQISHSMRLAGDVGTQGSPCPGAAWGLAPLKNNITIDLNGFTIWGDSNDDFAIAETGVVIDGLAGIKVINGTIRGWEHSIGTIGDSDRLVIKNIVTAGSSFSSIGVTGNDIQIVDTVATHNSINGIAVGGDRMRILRCTASYNDADGFKLSGANMFVASNEASVNDPSNSHIGGFEITASGRSVIQGNTATNNGSRGISVTGDGSKIKKNQSSGNADRGLAVTGNHNQILGNKASSGGFYGLDVVGTDNMLKSNVMSGDDQDGMLVFGDRNHVIGNAVQGNFVGILAGGDDIVISQNTARSNGFNGIEVVGEGGLMGVDHSVGVNISHNRVIANGFDPSFGPGLGIDASNPQVEAISGSKNIARGNANPNECLPQFLCP